MATARAQNARADDDDAAPDPLAHATPDAELAEAQLALGRPELSEVDEAELVEFEEAQAEKGRRRGRSTGSATSGELAVPEAAAVPAEPRRSPGARLANFLRGCWRELQRVQWPDRRQVMQATGVVIGFVIVAGVFLAVADFASQKIVNFILYGHS